MNAALSALRAISAGRVEYSVVTCDAYWAGGTIPADTIRALDLDGLIRIAGIAGPGMQWVSLTDAGWTKVYRADAEEAA